MQELWAADRAMRFSEHPDLPVVIQYLTTASLELKGLPSIFGGRRGAAVRDTEAAINDLRQATPNPRAISLTDEAITNAQICLQAHR